MSHIGQAGNYTELSREPAVKHARYSLKQRESRGNVEGGKEKKQGTGGKWECKVGEDEEVG